MVKKGERMIDISLFIIVIGLSASIIFVASLLAYWNVDRSNKNCLKFLNVFKYICYFMMIAEAIILFLVVIFSDVPL